MLYQDLLKGAGGLPVGGAGWGASNWEHLDELKKALSAGSGVDPSGFTGGRAMTLESLQGTLVNQLWNEKEAKLFRKLGATPVGTTVHQWAERTGVGDPNGAFVAEGASSIAHDQTLGRKWTTAKYMQTHRQATLQAVITGDQRMSLEEAIALETNAGALYLVQIAERALFTGDSSFNPYQFDGLTKQITDYESGKNVLSARARAGTETFEDRIKEGADIIRMAYGRPDCIFMDITSLTGFQDIIRSRTRYPSDAFNQRQDAAGNVIFNFYPTTHGNLDLYGDVFISSDGVTDGPGGPPVASNVTGAPSAAAISAAVVSRGTSAVTGEKRVWASGDAGAYYWSVVAVNANGDGAVEACTYTGADNTARLASRTATSANASDQLFSIACTVATGAARPTAIKLYRSKKDGTATDVRYVKTVAVPPGTTTSVTIYDGNDDLPGTSRAYVLTTDPQQDAMHWFQFAPMMRFNLYPSAAAVWPFLVLMYGSLGILKPARQVMIKNIIPDTLDWFD